MKMTITQLEERLLALNDEMELKQFENYYLDHSNDLNKINKKIYELLSTAGPEVESVGRKEEVFNFTYYRYMVENTPEVAGLRNRLDIGRRKEVYLDGDSHVSSGSDRQRELALNMRDDVIELMRRRDERAKGLGFASYPDLIYYCSELEREEVEGRVENYLDSNLDTANEIIEKYNEKYDIDLTRDNYFKKLRGLLSFADKREPSQELRKYYSELEYEDMLASIKVYEQDKISGIVIPVSIPYDVRLLITPLDSLWKMKVFYHECGHAASYSSIQEKGIYRIVSTFYDELMAVLFEKIGGEIFLEGQARKMYGEFQLLESVRCGLSFLFEAELWNVEVWDNPEQAEELFRHFQQQLDLPDREDFMWALDTFRSLDPVYMHNYVLGEIYSQRIVDQLRKEYGHDYGRWGKKIRAVMEKGMRTSLQEKLDKLNFSQYRGGDF